MITTLNAPTGFSEKPIGADRDPEMTVSRPKATITAILLGFKVGAGRAVRFRLRLSRVAPPAVMRLHPF